MHLPANVGGGVEAPNTSLVTTPGALLVVAELLEPPYEPPRPVGEVAVASRYGREAPCRSEGYVIDRPHHMRGIGCAFLERRRRNKRIARCSTIRWIRVDRG